MRDRGLLVLSSTLCRPPHDRPPSGRRVPTVGGVLLFGRDRRSLFPDAGIQAGRFAGVDKARILDHAELRGYPTIAIEDAMAFIEKHSIHGVRIEKVRRIDVFSLPPVAAREAIVNAVVHADYAQCGAPIRISYLDDRLEVESPGLLPLGLVVDDLRQGISKLRNRVLARVFHGLGLVEQWGSGIQRMTAACSDAGLAPPLLEEVGLRFRVTPFAERTGTPTVDPIEGPRTNELPFFRKVVVGRQAGHRLAKPARTLELLRTRPGRHGPPICSDPGRYGRSRTDLGPKLARHEPQRRRNVVCVS